MGIKELLVVLGTAGQLVSTSEKHHGSPCAKEMLGQAFCLCAGAEEAGKRVVLELNGRPCEI